VDSSALALVPTTTEFSPDLESTPRARRLVRASLRGLVPDDLVDDAELCVSELVTNSTLHARTSIRVTVGPSAKGIRLSVEDGSPTPPLQAPRTRTSSTGRGLALVTSLAREWGVEPSESGGKVVWCELSAGEPARAHHDVTPAFDLDLDWDEAPPVDRLPRPDEPVEPTNATGTKNSVMTAIDRMVLLGFPLVLGLRHDEHYAALVRECQLVRAAAASAGESLTEQPTSVPHSFADFADEMAARPKPDISEPLRLRLEALGRGEETVDLVYPVAPGATEQVLLIEGILDAMDEYSARNQLLTLTTPPEIRRLLSWILAEYARQAAGLEPRRWDGPIR
jgi:hypothetical protein